MLSAFKDAELRQWSQQRCLPGVCVRAFSTSLEGVMQNVADMRLSINLIIVYLCGYALSYTTLVLPVPQEKRLATIARPASTLHS